MRERDSRRGSRLRGRLLLRLVSWSRAAVAAEALAVLVIAGAAPAAVAAVREPALISKAPGPDGARADRDVDEIALSGTGRYVVFSSKARNLVPRHGGSRQIFRYDTRERRMIIVSRRPGHGAAAGANSTNPVVSASGRFVAFSSKARNLKNPDAGGSRYLYRKLFIADLRRDRLKMIKARADLLPTDITSDGRWLVVGTNGGDLGGPTRNGNGNVYLVSRRTGDATFVSRQSAAAGGEGAELRASHGTVSDDGRLVAFSTLAYNLGGDLASDWNVYLYDLQTAQLTQVSATPSGEGANGSSLTPEISANGRYITYSSDATNLSPRDHSEAGSVYRYEVASGRTDLVSIGKGAPRASGYDPSISANGRFVAFEGDRGIVVRDMRKRRSTVIPAPERYADLPALSLDARALAFIGEQRPIDDVYYQAYFARLAK